MASREWRVILKIPITLFLYSSVSLVYVVYRVKTVFDRSACGVSMIVIPRVFHTENLARRVIFKNIFSSVGVLIIIPNSYHVIDTDN